MKKLSKLNQRRLNNFKNNKRGYYSFWIFSFLFIISLFANQYFTKKNEVKNIAGLKIRYVGNTLAVLLIEALPSM